MRNATFLLLSLPLIFAACSTAPKRPYALKESGLMLYATDNDQKMLFVKDVIMKDGHRFCLTPQHDAVSGSSNGMTLGAGTALAKEGVSIGGAKSELALGGRSPSVLISRELLYRACELSSNLNADLATTMHIYERFLQAVEKISLAQTEIGTEPLTLAESAKIAAVDTSVSGKNGSGSSSEGSETGYETETETETETENGSETYE